VRFIENIFCVLRVAKHAEKNKFKKYGISLAEQENGKVGSIDICERIDLHNFLQLFLNNALILVELNSHHI